MLRMEEVRRSKGRPERRFMDVVKGGVEVAGEKRMQKKEEEDSLREQLEEEHLSIIP